MGPMGHIFLSINLVNGLACGFFGEIPEIFKKCVIWLHFPILELKTPRNLTYSLMAAVIHFRGARRQHPVRT